MPSLSLQEMLDLQRDLQRVFNGYELEDQSTELRIDNIVLNVFALTKELSELTDEIGWKPWATSRHINRERAVEELVDVWHFFMNIMLHLGVDAEELAAKYAAKNKINHRRQTDGYDGVSGKCPQCHRDIAESGTKEVIAASTQRVDIHCICGAYLGSRAV